MKKLCFILFFAALCYQIKAQEALHNFGNLKIHDEGRVGFYHDFINDGVSEDNQGLAGFFSVQSQRILGAFEPTFKDLEILVGKNLFLEIGVNVTNNSNFIFGNVITPRNLSNVNLEYINDSFYTGDTDLTKVDGYSALTSKQDFIFPIGYEDRLRPLEILSETIIPRAKSAYFSENPNTPSTFNISFDTDLFENSLTTISTLEFWDLDTETTSGVRLSWTNESEIEQLVNSIENLRVVGWHAIDKEWKNLGNIAVDGNLSEGHITSDIFLPDDYDAITFGAGFNREDIQLANYILSPNGDGTNDLLVFKEVTLSPNNVLKIYNRWGREVYQMQNYNNSFQGKANVDNVVKKNTSLPAGIYYYIIELIDINLTHQGYLYITD